MGLRPALVLRRPRPALFLGLLSLAAACAACSSTPSGSSTSTSTLPPLPAQVGAVVTLIGPGAAAGTGDRVVRIALSSIPPEVFTATKVGTFPDAVAVSPSGKTAYVTSYSKDTLTPIDLSTGKAGRPIAVGRGPAGIAIAPSGEMAYVTDAGSTPIGDTVTPIDLRTRKALAPITVGEGPQAIAISASGEMAYVTDAGAVVTGQQGSIGDTVTPIDLRTRKALAPITVGNAPIAIALTDTTAYVANSGSESVTPIDLSSRTAAAAVPLDGAPQSIAIADGYAWVASSKTTISPGNSLTPIALSTDHPGSALVVGASPSAVAVAEKTAWVVCAGELVSVDVSSKTPTLGRRVAIKGGPYALALYPVRGATAG